MIPRDRYFGGAKYFNPGAGTTTNVPVFPRMYIIKGVSAGTSPIFQVPFAGVKSIDNRSLVTQVPIGWTCYFLQYEQSGPTLNFRVNTQRGTNLITSNGNKLWKVTLLSATTYWGTWKVRAQNLL